MLKRDPAWLNSILGNVLFGRNSTPSKERRKRPWFISAVLTEYSAHSSPPEQARAAYRDVCILRSPYITLSKLSCPQNPLFHVLTIPRSCFVWSSFLRSLLDKMISFRRFLLYCLDGKVENILRFLSMIDKSFPNHFQSKRPMILNMRFQMRVVF